MLYKEFLDHIYKRYSGNVKLELNRMTGLLSDMEDPERDLVGFHVGGTNGKGSVCAALEALCIESGLKTALNTSPHLINYSERFRINGSELPFTTILSTFRRYETLFKKWDASFFEITTALAFAMFSKQKVDVAVIEVGLGGRLDATNLFVPDISVITNVGLDHTKTLGGTLEIIAAEKAGIIKKGIPLIIGDMEESPRSIVEGVAVAKQAPVFRFGRDWNTEILSDSLEGISFNYSFGKYEFKNLQANLIGEHQTVNVGTALTAFLLYAEKKNIPISEEKIRTALKQINWKGRLQVLSQRPLVITDGAHNMHGAKSLLRTLDQLFPNRKVKFLVSILRDKDYPDMISLFCSKAEFIYITQNQSERAASIEEQVEEVKKHNVPFKTAPTVDEAYALALSECKPEDVLIACGSLYTVGEILAIPMD